MAIEIPGVKRDSDIEALFMTVGFVAIQWGHCEQSLELLVNSLFRLHGGNKLPRRKRMPKRLSDKIAFVKECASQIPSLAQFRNTLEKLAADFEALTPIRHDLVHGAITDDPIANGVFTFIRLETHPDIHEVKSFKFDLNNFPSLAKLLVRLGSDAPKIAKRIFDAHS